MILGIGWQGWTAIIGAACSLITVIVIPSYKYFKKKRDQYNNTITGLHNISSSLNKIDGNLVEVGRQLQKNESDVEALSEKVADLQRKTDIFETQQLKYMINDAFYGYSSIEEIPYEVLMNASQCCDIYVGKGLNHETGARCRLIYQEIERRQQAIVHHEQEGGNHE